MNFLVYVDLETQTINLLRKVKSLNNDADTLRRAFFLAQLPSQVRAILASQNFADIHELPLQQTALLQLITYLNLR